jgi:phospholipase/carboxylesterase
VGDADGHIPAAQAEESARLLAAAGASVDFRVYPGVDHAILDDEIDAARALVTSLPIIAPAS